MSRGTALLVAAALFGALVGRSVLSGAGEEPDLEPLPVSRVVADDGVDADWERTADLRDPFEPLVLPTLDLPETGDEAEGDPDDGTVE